MGWLQAFLYPGPSGSDKTPASKAPLTSSSCKAGLIKSGRLWAFRRVSLPLPAGSWRGFPQDMACGDLVELLEVNLTVGWGPHLWFPLEFLTLGGAPGASAMHPVFPLQVSALVSGESPLWEAEFPAFACLPLQSRGLSPRSQESC